MTEAIAVDALEKLIELMSPAPWRVSHEAHDERPKTNEVCDLVNDTWIVTEGDLRSHSADAAGIVALRNAGPAILAELRRLHDVSAAWKGLASARLAYTDAMSPIERNAASWRVTAARARLVELHEDPSEKEAP